VACPYFFPLKSRDDDFDPRSAMLPLGGRWEGECRARAAPGRPEPENLNGICCLGYARDRCAAFPQNDQSADAVRFHIVRDTGDRIELYCVLERDHHPYAHGPLEYSLLTGSLREAPFGAIIQRQAEAYVESYRARKHEPLKL
jgi:hypothetical protein